MIKLFSVLLILAGSAYCGKYVSEKQKRKCGFYKSVLSMLSAAENRLVSCRLPLKELAEALAFGERYPGFIADCAHLCSNGEAFPDAWKISICRSADFFDKRIAESLLRLGDELGKTEIDGQISAIVLCRKELTELLEEEEEKRKKYSGIFPTLGILAGIWAVIILL